MPRIIVPPIKTQGIKTKLVPWIKEYVQMNEGGRWVEPFMGSGVVGFNIKPDQAVFADSNPYIIAIYKGINGGEITSGKVRAFLEREGAILEEKGQDHYYHIRERFNSKHAPLDFLFLNRSCFNGMIRFNSKGGFNVPFNHKPERFSKAYVTKVVNQVKDIEKLCQLKQWDFVCQDFRETLKSVSRKDFIYCDPPYAGRHTDYFNAWGDAEDKELFELLSKTKARFMLSTWHSNQYRENEKITSYWSKFHLVTQNHFYHVGAKEKNRKPMLEALAMNYAVEEKEKKSYTKLNQAVQPQLFEKNNNYTT